jgi:hypothetical protein
MRVRMKRNTRSQNTGLDMQHNDDQKGKMKGNEKKYELWTNMENNMNIE